MIYRSQFGAGLSIGVALVLGVMAISSRAADKDIIINEIMYHPPLDLEELQYVELFNRGKDVVDLSGWSFSKGINFVFPNGTWLTAGGYLVVCRSTNIFAGNYGKQIPAIGNFEGKLSHHGEKIELDNAAGLSIDSVKYSDKAPWPRAPDGHSTSLERICPFSSGRDPGNWASSAMPPFERPAGTPGRQNDSFSATPLPVISDVTFQTPPPGTPAKVTATVTDDSAVKSVALLWCVASSRGQTLETQAAMQRTAGDEQHGTYEALVPAQPDGTLVRFRIRAANAQATRLEPGPNEPLPTFSYSTVLNTNSARIAFAYVIHVSPSVPESHVRVWNGKTYDVPSSPTRGDGAFIYVPPSGGEVLTFDHVYVRPRKGGMKVHFKKEHSFKGMTGINVIFESSPRWLLSEAMGYELFRLAGVPACLTEHVRLWMDGRPYGYYFVIEQPNKSFLARNQRNDNGSLYKVYWMYQSLVDQHHKKTRPATDYDDIINLEAGLTRTKGEKQWQFIQKNFNVDEFAGYYAVSMCVQNWDGFFNNYYLYHDEKDTGKWEMYPWDNDKTWGDYDGASPNYDWYEMPLTFGMDDGRSRNRGFGFGANGWWRPPGYFSGPVLANEQFRKVFLARLGEICTNAFTEEKMLPLINALEKRLEPEIQVRARLRGQNPREALGTFYSDIQSLRNQVKYRREFILQQIPKDRAAH